MSVCYIRSNRSHLSENKKCKIVDVDAIEGVIAKIALRDLDLVFEGKKFEIFIYLKR